MRDIGPATAPVAALVTGATAGIGHAFAVELARRGHDLVLVARDEERLTRVAAQLRQDSRVAVDVLAADLVTAAGRAKVSQVLRDEDRPVGLLVNNAGYALRGAFGDNDIADEEAVLDVLVRAPMQLCHAALGAMSRRGSGAVVNVASVAGFMPRGTYGAHKAWLISFSRWAHVEYAAKGVKVMALCPGLVRTEFHARMAARIDNIPGWMWLDADSLVRDALLDLDRGVAVSIPSVRYQVLAAAARHAPAGLVTRVAKLGR